MIKERIKKESKRKEYLFKHLFIILINIYLIYYCISSLIVKVNKYIIIIIIK